MLPIEKKLRELAIGNERVLLEATEGEKRIVEVLERLRVKREEREEDARHSSLYQR